MKKFTVISLATLALALSFAGCNSNSSSSFEYENSSNAAISSFKLCEDDSVLANLDTVFFAIDLNGGRIFNADSLPYATRTNKLVPRITAYAGYSRLTLTDRLDNGKDSVHEYDSESPDTINFANGPVYIDITSPDGTFSKRYTVSVNVHQVVSDSLAWDRTAFRTLPTSLQAPTAQRTARTADGFYCLSTDGSDVSLAFSSAPDDNDSWQELPVSLPDGADINSFCGASDALYIIAGGILFTSGDGDAWTSTGVAMHALYGGFGSEVLGSALADGQWRVISYPSHADGRPMPDGMPVEGTSLPVTYTTPLSIGNQAVMVGGRRADGSLSADTWGYDGTAWSKISQKPLPVALEGMTLVPFYVFHTNEIFVATEYSVLLAFGGRNADGVSRDVYISYYLGLDWTRAQDYLQLPSFIPALEGAQAYVFDTTMRPSARAASAWTEIANPLRMPATVSFAPMAAPDCNPMAIRPVESWQCPFIYLFGGYNAGGTLSNTLWRATLNRLQFEPLQ